jgi:hypothetical protein
VLVSHGTLLADGECKLWDFKKPANGVPELVGAMLRWNGGTEQQCRRLHDSVEVSLKKTREESKATATAAEQHATQAQDDWVHASSSQKAPAAVRWDALKAQADKAEKQAWAASRSYDDFWGGKGCTCVERGETALELHNRLADEQRRDEQQKRDAERKVAEVRRIQIEQQREADRKIEQEAQHRAENATTAAQKEAAEDEAKRAAERQQESAAALQQLAAAERQANTAMQEQPGARNQTDRSRSSGPDTSSSGGDSGGARGTDGEGRAGEQLLATMPDAFGGKSKPSPPSSEGGVRLFEPFPQGPSIRSPGDKPLPAPNSQDERESERQYELTKSVAEKLIETTADVLSEDIKQAPRAMSGDPRGLQTYLEGAEDTRSLVRGLGKFIQYGGYTVKVMDAVNAETNTKRQEAIGGLGVDIAKDIASYGLKEYAATVFGPRIAAVLSGPVGWVAGIATEVLRPEQLGADPPEIIRDTSGRYSTKEKQEALAAAWKAFDKNGDSWSSTRRKQLDELNAIVAKEAKTK